MASIVYSFLVIFLYLGTVVLGLMELPEAATNKIDQLFQDMCDRQGVDLDEDVLTRRGKILQDCVTNQATLMNSEVLQEAQITRSVEKAFGKYCQRLPHLFNCFDSVAPIFLSCMNKEEQMTFNRTVFMKDDLLEYICSNNGEHLTTFAVNKGPQCVQEQAGDLKNCFKPVSGEQFISKFNDMSLETMSRFNYTEEICDGFDEIRHCVNKELYQCSYSSTPAYIVDDAFRAVRRRMQCSKSTSSSFSVASILITLMMFVLVKFYSISDFDT